MLGTYRFVCDAGEMARGMSDLSSTEAVLEKKVSLDTPVRDLVDKGFRFADPKVGTITLRQLATHTSGLPRLPDNIAAEADPLDGLSGRTRERLSRGMAPANRLCPAHRKPVTKMHFMSFSV